MSKFDYESISHFIRLHAEYEFEQTYGVDFNFYRDHTPYSNIERIAHKYQKQFGDGPHDSVGEIIRVGDKVAVTNFMTDYKSYLGLHQSSYPIRIGIVEKVDIHQVTIKHTPVIKDKSRFRNTYPTMCTLVLIQY